MVEVFKDLGSKERFIINVVEFLNYALSPGFGLWDKV